MNRSTMNEKVSENHRNTFDIRTYTDHLQQKQKQHRQKIANLTKLKDKEWTDFYSEMNIASTIIAPNSLKTAKKRRNF